MPEAVQGGTTIVWREMGQGTRPLLLLHCGLGRSGMWRRVAAGLEDSHRMIAPDLPGHGRSGPWPDGDPHDAAFAAMAPFLEDGLHLVGHSFGATVALRLALRAPGRVAALTLIEPVFFAAARGTAAAVAHRAAEESLFEAFATGDLMHTARLFNRLWGGGVPWDSFPETAQRAMADNMPFVVGTEPSLWQDRHGMLAPGGLEAVQRPVTLVRGSDTVPIIAAVHQGLLARLPNACEAIVEGAGHMLIVTHPDAVVEAIRQTEASSAALA